MASVFLSVSLGLSMEWNKTYADMVIGDFCDEGEAHHPNTLPLCAKLNSSATP